MISSKSSLIKYLPLIFSILLTIAGCDKNNPVDHHEEHNEAEGMVLKVGGVNIVVVREGTVESGTITVKAGESTPEISARFLDHDGHEFIPDEEGSSLAFELADDTIADATVVPGKEWEFTVNGKTVGETTIVIKLMHHDHSDFTTPPIPLEVTN